MYLRPIAQYLEMCSLRDVSCVCLWVVAFISLSLHFLSVRRTAFPLSTYLEAKNALVPNTDNYFESLSPAVIIMKILHG